MTSRYLGSVGNFVVERFVGDGDEEIFKILPQGDQERDVRFTYAEWNDIKKLVDDAHVDWLIRTGKDKV